MLPTFIVTKWPRILKYYLNPSFPTHFHWPKPASGCIPPPSTLNPFLYLESVYTGKLWPVCLLPVYASNVLGGGPGFGRGVYRYSKNKLKQFFSSIWGTSKKKTSFFSPPILFPPPLQAYAASLIWCASTPFQHPPPWTSWGRPPQRIEGWLARVNTLCIYIYIYMQQPPPLTPYT